MIEIDLARHIDDVLVRGQEVGVIVAQDVPGPRVVPEAPEEGVNLLHSSLQQGVLEEGQDGDGHLEEVTAAIGEEVIPDAQDQAEGHRIEEKRLEPFLEPQRVGHTFIHKMLL